MAQSYVVTGANRGIGIELVRQLAARGDDVIGTVRNPEAAGAVHALGARVEPLDVTRDSSAADLAARLAGQPVDVLINNAAVGAAGPGIEHLHMDDLSRYFNVNSIGPIRVAQALLPNLRQGRRRIIASVTSLMGSIAENHDGGYYAYRASKTALNGLNKTLSQELGREGFCCVVLHPGWVQTDMGGPNAPLAVQDSAAGLIRVLDRLSPGDTGRFLDYQGREVPW